MKLSAERIAILMKTRIIMKAAKKKVTEEKKTVMTRRRAKKNPKKTTGSLVIVSILTFFHLCDNDNYVPRGQEGYNPVNNLGTIYSAVTGNFSDVWKPGKNICIDEGMIPFRGKVHFKVYNSDKPDKYSVKSYQLCDSSNGYCCRFEISTDINQEPPSTKGKTYDLVMRLMQPYLNVGRCLYVDNYYTSPTLFAELRTLGPVEQPTTGKVFPMVL